MLPVNMNIGLLKEETVLGESLYDHQGVYHQKEIRRQKSSEGRKTEVDRID